LLLLQKTIVAFAAVLCFAISSVVTAVAQEKSIVVASTTSTQDSGLFDHLLPLFTEKTGIAVKVLAQGTGQALDTGRRGEADVVLVHNKSSENRFVDEGDGVKRIPVMYNDFVLVGPKSDPAHIRDWTDVAKAFKAIKAKSAAFISRGDRSGTHIKELTIWHRDIGIDIEHDRGSWYRSSGQGMDATLRMAAASNAYVLSDRATWLNFKNKGDLEILVENDKRMFNQYAVILVNPAKHPGEKHELGQQFINWLVSLEGQNAIANYRIKGEQLFFPNASDPNA
jgi:tungstate transport system substrate-binding protein